MDAAASSVKYWQKLCVENQGRRILGIQNPRRRSQIEVATSVGKMDDFGHTTQILLERGAWLAS